MELREYLSVDRRTKLLALLRYASVDEVADLLIELASKQVTGAQQAIAGANDSPQIKVCPECGGDATPVPYLLARHGDLVDFDLYPAGLLHLLHDFQGVRREHGIAAIVPHDVHVHAREQRGPKHVEAVDQAAGDPLSIGALLVRIELRRGLRTTRYAFL